jgi:hypothetical protein
MKRAALYLLVLSICGAVEQKAVAQMPVADDAAATKLNEVSPATAADLDTQIGDTLIRLTRARLEVATRLNAQVRGTVPPDDVAIVQEELRAIDGQERTRGQLTDWFSTLLAIADIEKISAKADWRRASKLRREYPAAISELDVEIRRLNARLADLNLQRGKLAGKGTASERQNWALLYLSVKMQELTDRVRLLEHR